jgi:soluble lytic murein transglycosylase-like protein
MVLRCLTTLLAGLMALIPAAAKETIYFTNGFSLEVDSHTEANQCVVLRLGAGTLEFPARSIARIEILLDSSGTNDLKAAVSPEDLLTRAADEQRLPPEFVRSVAKIESDFHLNAISPKGALGLMQLMPSTAAELGVNATQADQNARGGAKYLRNLLLRYRGNSALALAAYNAGPAAVDKFGGVPPYEETRRYVLKVLREYERQHKLAVGQAAH